MLGSSLRGTDVMRWGRTRTNRKSSRTENAIRDPDEGRFVCGILSRHPYFWKRKFRLRGPTPVTPKSKEDRSEQLWRALGDGRVVPRAK
jgi:hypothetical protein